MPGAAVLLNAVLLNAVLVAQLSSDFLASWVAAERRGIIEHGRQVGGLRPSIELREIPASSPGLLASVAPSAVEFLTLANGCFQQAPLDLARVLRWCPGPFRAPPPAEYAIG